MSSKLGFIFSIFAIVLSSLLSNSSFNLNSKSIVSNHNHVDIHSFNSHSDNDDDILNHIHKHRHSDKEEEHEHSHSLSLEFKPFALYKDGTFNVIYRVQKDKSFFHFIDTRLSNYVFELLRPPQLFC